MTNCANSNVSNNTTTNKIINTPWGKIEKISKSKLGMVELQMSFDYNANILYVTILQAKNLKSFVDNIAKGPFTYYVITIMRF